MKGRYKFSSEFKQIKSVFHFDEGGLRTDSPSGRHLGS